jgi:glycosyltransferase involved in cell wall biosynthesis
VTRSSVPSEPGVRVHNGMAPNSPELVELFRASDVFVMPTRADAFGIVAVEAAASGLAVVMSDVGGARDIVVEGETGYLIAIDDLAALTRRLAALVASPELARRLGGAARARAETRFNLAQNGRKVVDKLISVAQSGNRAATHAH